MSTNFHIRLLLIIKYIMCAVIFYILFQYTFDHHQQNKHHQVPTIVIPGGGLTPEGHVPDYVAARLDKAIALYDKYKTQHSSCGLGPCMITLSAGTTHTPPPLDVKGFPLYESSVGAQYLLKAGIPARNILEEKLSLDTLGNAFFLRTIHTDPNDWTELIIITNKWHMARVQAIFTTIFGLPSTGPTLRPSEAQSPGYHLQFEAVENLLEPKVLQLRESREADSLRKFQSHTVPLLHSLPDAHQFLFGRHQAYSTERFTEGHVAEKIDAELLKSY